MIEIEAMPILIESHRAYLRSLAHPVPTEVRVPAPRETVGRTLVRFGRWLDNHCPEIAPAPPMATGRHA